MLLLDTNTKHTAHKANPVVTVLVFVRSARCNNYFYIVFVSQTAIILVFILIERSAIILVFVFVTKIALLTTCFENSKKGRSLTSFHCSLFLFYVLFSLYGYN